DRWTIDCAKRSSRSGGRWYRIRASGASVIEPAAGRGPVTEDRRRLEPHAVHLFERLEPLDDRREGEAIRVAEQPAPEGREAGPGDHGQVDVARARDDPVLQRACSLVDHDEDAPLLDRPGRDLTTLGGDALAEFGVDRVVRTDFLPVLVAVEPEPALPAEARGLSQLQQGRRRAEPVAEGLVEDGGRVTRDVEPDLVEQAEGAHRHPEIQERAVDLADPGALREEPARLVQVRR